MSDEADDRRARGKLEAQRDRDDLLALLATAAGRRCLRRVIDRCGIDRPAFSSDPLAMAYNEGRRAVGIEISAEFHELAPEEWHSAMHEAGRMSAAHTDGQAR